MPLKRINVFCAVLIVLLNAMVFVPFGALVIRSYKGYDGWELLTLPLVASYLFFALSSLTVFIPETFPRLRRSLLAVSMVFTMLLSLISLMYGGMFIILVSSGIALSIFGLLSKKLDFGRALLISNLIGSCSMIYWALRFTFST